MRLILYLFLSFCVFQFSCNGKPDKKNLKTETKDGVAKSYFKDGKLKAEITYKDGKKTGKAVEYYKTGGKHLEIDYVNGIKHGIVRRFFENGELSEKAPYTNGKRNGVEKKWRENGKLHTEAPYRNDQPCQGLKEYLLDGTIKKNYPTMVITPEDKLETEGLFLLKLTLSDKSRRVSYFNGRLTSSCLGDSLDPIYFDENTGVGVIRYYLQPGGYQMEEINIIAKVKTLLGNTHLVQRSYNVAIDN